LIYLNITGNRDKHQNEQKLDLEPSNILEPIINWITLLVSNNPTGTGTNLLIDEIPGT
jgi:hypothetical protein